MPSFFSKQQNRLVYHYDAETLWVEPWGRNSLRVRAVHNAEMPYTSGLTKTDWALLPPEPCEALINDTAPGGVPAGAPAPVGGASIRNGNIELRISPSGHITIVNGKGKALLEEYQPCGALKIGGREFRSTGGDEYALKVRFESLDPNEKIYGLGQYQQPYLNLKGADLELAQRNSQASVPFALSSLGYGFLWNNPAVGRVVFGRNLSTWEACSTKYMDYWVTAGDSPAEIEEAYARATGTVPMMSDYGTGFWQCKLRYQTQDEVLEVARGYKSRGLPLSVIVIDFFHWTCLGDWKFDPRYWPDPEGMVKELKAMGVELMVSIWPPVDRASENYREMLEKGYLIRSERGSRVDMDVNISATFYDATNPAARDFVWEKVKQNYYDKGIKLFWLDVAEPEYSVYDFDNYRYYIGSNLATGNIYPGMYAQTFFDGMKREGQQGIVNLIRCAWAGSQRYGALVWSGDIHSNFESFRDQLAAGLNMGIAGIPWWTTDIGGFTGADIGDPAFHELFVRWFQWGCFCPVMRLHGSRNPHTPPLGSSGGGEVGSGAGNEVWSFTEEVYEICTKYLSLREKLRPYVKAQMKAAHEKGTPVMRPLFYDFPHDPRAWETEDAYMFGPDYLVAPILYPDQRERQLYLPAGTRWTDCWSGATYEGGACISAPAPLDKIPVYSRTGAVFV
ncbi:MAG: glycoside hydrolase family 31 protein [Spirochaetaceae bacterium]|jgi:alpha-D-xyloside xylohydrolase|nr:glycoside hydrolase family 31 protein [Spirochaetaceae bacterium]